MKKLFILFILLSIFINSTVYAAGNGLTANASPATVGVNSNVTSVSVPFTFMSRNLIVINNDTTAYVYIDTNDSTNTSAIGECFLLGPGKELDLYDFISSGVSILYDNGRYSTDKEASPISVITTY